MKEVRVGEGKGIVKTTSVELKVNLNLGCLSPKDQRPLGSLLKEDTLEEHTDLTARMRDF